jgi:hypothetical protein
VRAARPLHGSGFAGNGMDLGLTRLFFDPLTRGRVAKHGGLMKISSLAAGFALAVCILLVGASARGQMHAGPGRGMGRGGRIYDPKTVETVSGEVASIERTAPHRGMGSGIHLLLKTDAGTIPVHLGPSGYVDGQKVKLLAGDKISVTGSRITFDGKPAIVAAEIHKGDEILRLRDENGVPLWAGMHHH